MRAGEVEAVGERGVDEGDCETTVCAHAPVKGVDIVGAHGAGVEFVVVGADGVDVEGGEGESGEGGRGAPFRFCGTAGEGAGCGEAEDEEVEKVRKGEGREGVVEVGGGFGGGAEGAGGEGGGAVG